MCVCVSLSPSLLLPLLLLTVDILYFVPFHDFFFAHALSRLSTKRVSLLLVHFFPDFFFRTFFFRRTHLRDSLLGESHIWVRLFPRIEALYKESLTIGCDFASVLPPPVPLTFGTLYYESLTIGCDFFPGPSFRHVLRVTCDV